MKAAVYYSAKDIRIEEVPKPEIGDGEILVKVVASGICGTDAMEWYRIKKAPRIFGHEIAGEIVESKTAEFKVGQRVFVSHHVPCGECKYCADGNETACEALHKGNYDPGGYAEFVRVPVENVKSGTYVLPEDVTYEEGTMIEPLACSVRALRVIGVKKGQTVLVLGSGISGILNIQIAKLLGARVIATDVDPYRLEKAKQFGADEVLNGKEDINVKADRVLICTGAEAVIRQAFECVDRKGVILLFAVPPTDIQIPTVNFWRNELSLVSSYGAGPKDLAEALQLIKDKMVNVRDTVTHTLPLAEIQKGFEIVTSAGESLKVVLKP